MGSVGELILTGLVLLAVIYYKVPGLKEWVRGVKRYSEVPPAVMSRPEDQPTGISIDTSIIPTKKEPVLVELTEQVIVQWMAAQKTVDGWRWSANAIYQYMKGNRNEVMRWVREVRGGGAPLAEPEDDQTLTPIAGRPTRRSYYQDDPDLQFQEPPQPSVRQS